MESTSAKPTDSACRGCCRCPKCGGGANWWPGSPNIKGMHVCHDYACGHNFEEHDQAVYSDGLFHGPPGPRGSAMGFGTGKYESLEALAAKMKAGEPWFVIRGQDAFAVPAILAYAQLLATACQTARALNHFNEAEQFGKAASSVVHFANNVSDWQFTNTPKLPD